MLCSFGTDHYLEIIGPDPDQPDPDRARPFGLDDLEAARLVTWCVHPDDLDAHVAAAGAAGYPYTDPRPMSRQAPDGLLEWSLAHPTFDTHGGTVPFCIDWGSTPHPSTVAAAGLTLVGLRATHPFPGDLANLLGSVGVGLMIDEGPEAALHARVSGPAGAVDLPT